MTKDVVPAVAVGLAGVLTGNELGTLTGVHPALGRLPMPSLLLAEQTLTRRYGTLMPPLMAATIAVAAAAAGTTTGGRRRLFVAAAGSYAAMLAVTLAGNLPLNAATLRLPASTDEEEVRSVRRRWDRLHAVRVALDLIGLALAAAAATRVSDRPAHRRPPLRRAGGAAARRPCPGLVAGDRRQPLGTQPGWRRASASPPPRP